MFSRRSLFAAIGLALPLVAATSAEAAKSSGKAGKKTASASKGKGKSSTHARSTSGKRSSKG